MGKTWRLILDQKCDGYYNMAVDEAILLGYSSSKIPTLRLYGWDKPFISLGYNQNSREVLNSQNEIPFVRRITGGSAILHHKELTYSLVCSLEDLNLPKAVKVSYKIICSFLKHFYGQLGLKAYFANDLKSEDQESIKGLGKYNNFCFSSWQHFDLLVEGRKIGGSAQRRRKNIIFQHGSIPQEINSACIKRTIKSSGDLKGRATSLEEVLGKSLSFELLSSLLYSSFKLTFGTEFNRKKLLPTEEEKVASLLKAKYRTKEWNNYKIFKNA